MIIDESLTRHLIQIVISPGNTTTANIQFANHANRQFITITIDDKLFHIQLRLTDCHMLGMGQFLVIGCNGYLSGTITIEDTRLCHLAQLIEQLVREFLSSRPADVNKTDDITEIITGEPRLPA